MIYVEAIMLTSLIFFGGYCSFTDFREGIVPNKAIATGFLIGIIAHGVLLIFGAAEYYPSWLLNMVIADVIAFCMFLGKIWAAGDAKLFMLLFFWIPPRLFDSGTLAHSVVPFIFIFVPSLLWMIVDSVVRLVRKEERKHQSFSLKSFFGGFISIVIETTAFYSMWFCLFPDFINQQALLVAALMLVYAYICGSLTIMKKWYIVALHALILIILWIAQKWTLYLPSWKNYLIIISAIVLRRFCSMYNYQLIPTATAKKGMIPAMETIILFRQSRVHSLPTDPSEELTARISEEEAAAIRRWENSATGKQSIWIVRKVPFAIMILIGFVGWIGFRLLGR